MEERNYFIYLSCIPVLGILAQWLAWKLRLPSILTLLGFGIMLGFVYDPDELLSQLLHIAPTEHELTSTHLLLPIVSLSVAVILFEGGLSLRFEELRVAGRGVMALITVGTIVTAALTTLAARTILGFDLGVALLLGMILVVTGPTVVIPLVRQIRPVSKVGSIAKWEGIVIDPVGAVAAVLVFELVEQGADFSMIAVPIILGKTACIGLMGGLVAAAVLIAFVKNYWIPDYLHGVMFLAVALATFALSNLLQEESGLVTVTVLGIALANQKSVRIHHVIEFKEHLGILLISCLFIVLGSTFDPAVLWDLGWRGLLFLAALILVVRPASVFIAGFLTKMTINEKAFLAFLAPRGIVAAAVTSVFALKLTSLEEASPELLQQAEQLVPVTFLVIVGTVSVYGLLAGPWAKWLNLSDSDPQGVLFAGADDWIRKIAATLQAEGLPVMLVDTNYSHVAAARMEGLPAECASILSDHVRHELDLCGIGRLLALTANDEVNALAVNEFAGEFGRANVYQLSRSGEGSGKRSSVSEHLLGRILFRDGLTHDEFADRMHRGAEIKKTKLTEAFTAADYHQEYSEDVLPLFCINSKGLLKIYLADETPELVAGQTVVSLIAAPNEPRDATGEAESE